MARTIKLLLAAAVTAAAGYIAASPYLAVSAMRDAALAGNAPGVAEHVDFPALKDSLKANLTAAAMKSTGASGEDNPMAGAGAMFAMALIGPMIDAVVSPEGLTQLMRQGRLGMDQAQDEAARTPGADAAPEVDTDMSYRDFSTFVVTMKDRDSKEPPMALVFKRHGVASWKLTSLDLPL